MEQSDMRRAVQAATRVASSLNLPAEDAIVLHNSNRLALRLKPCDVLARVSHGGQEGAWLELDRAQRLAEVGCPVGALQSHVSPIPYTRDNFVVTLWTYYEPAARDLSPVEYAEALERLHAGMREVGMASPRYSGRIAEAQHIAGNPDLSPELTQADREFLSSRLHDLGSRIEDYGAAEQLLHGEPHPGNVLSTRSGALFVDLETLCRGPVEFDLAHVPEAVCEHYPGADPALLNGCRQLVLAMVAAWRWRLGDEYPDRRRWGQEILRLLRDGPPWPPLGAMASRFEAV